MICLNIIFDSLQLIQELSDLSHQQDGCYILTFSLALEAFCQKPGSLGLVWVSCELTVCSLQLCFRIHSQSSEDRLQTRAVLPLSGIREELQSQLLWRPLKEQRLGKIWKG